MYNKEANKGARGVFKAPALVGRQPNTGNDDRQSCCKTILMNLFNLFSFLLVAGLVVAFLLTLAIWIGLAAFPDKHDDFFNPYNQDL